MRPISRTFHARPRSVQLALKARAGYLSRSERPPTRRAASRRTDRTTAHPVLKATRTCATITHPESKGGTRTVYAIHEGPKRHQIFFFVPVTYKPLARAREISKRPIQKRKLTDKVAIALANRPSDGRGPGVNPRPPCAFKVSMFNVFCNSH